MGVPAFSKIEREMWLKSGVREIKACKRLHDAAAAVL